MYSFLFLIYLCLNIFHQDNNTGLTKQCLASLYKKNIQRLTKVIYPLCLVKLKTHKYYEALSFLHFIKMHTYARVTLIKLLLQL